MSEPNRRHHVRIDVRNRERERMFAVTVDMNEPPRKVREPDSNGPEVFLNWDQAFDERGFLTRCPVCGCTELFVRKDFPQVVGMTIVVLAAAAALGLFAMGQVLLGLFILGLLVLVDAVFFLFARKCLVCYRCRSEFRDIPIPPDQSGWDLATGEKYRVQAEHEVKQVDDKSPK